jgi:uncharacterized lipoprotein YehR (DUF1307 family)
MKSYMIENSLKGTKMMALVFALVMTIFIMACPDSSNIEEEAKQAQKEVTKSLILPPDAVQRKTKIKYEHDGLYFNYGTNDDIKTVEEFYTKSLVQKNFPIIAKSDNGLSYRDDAERLITINWYPRDPDIFDYQSVLHLLVQPLPPEVKKTAPKQKDQ